jgi:hypothetical protein
MKRNEITINEFFFSKLNPDDVILHNQKCYCVDSIVVFEEGCGCRDMKFGYWFWIGIEGVCNYIENI